MPNHLVNVFDKLSLISDHWSPKIIGELNGQHVKLAKIKGEFVWHDHANEDELFMILKGQMTLKFEDGNVDLKEGDMYIVPRGVTHKPVASEECSILLFEPNKIAHTGEVESELTKNTDEWI